MDCRPAACGFLRQIAESRATGMEPLSNVSPLVMSSPDLQVRPELWPVIRTFEMADGYRLHSRFWSPAAWPRGRILALHGIQSHSGWYEWSCRRLCQAGYEICFLDRRGSGMNERERGHAESGAQLVSDVEQVASQLASDDPVTGDDSRGGDPAAAIPLTLLAISWGGKIAAAAAARAPERFAGLILCTPGLFPRIGPRPDQAVRLKLARWLRIRRRMVPVPLNDPALFTDLPDWRDWIRRDPLALHEVTSGFLLAGQDLDRMREETAHQIDCPSLLVLAGKDRIIDNEATRRFWQSLPVPHKHLIEYPEACHTLEFDSQRETFLRDLLCWLETREIATDR